jgi:hypothetical protein
MTRSTSNPLRHLTYANVMATLALFLVVAGGTALAAGQMHEKQGIVKKHVGKKHGKKHHPKKPKPVVTEEGVVKDSTVDSAAVVDGSLQSADLADGNGVSGIDVVPGSLTGSDVADGSLTAAQLNAGSLTGADLAQGLVTGDKLAAGTIGSANLAPNSVGPTNLVTNSLSGDDIATEALTGANINEASFGPVPDTQTLGKVESEQLLPPTILIHETPEEAGAKKADGTFTIMKECPVGQRVINAGPANVGPQSEILNNGPVLDEDDWAVTINPHGVNDPFKLVMVCVSRFGVVPR